MQILIQVVAAPDTTSIRSRINNDAKLQDYYLTVHSTKKIGRNGGWTKLHSLSDGALGAINIEWESATKMLLCRITTKSPQASILGKEYLAHTASSDWRDDFIAS